MRWILFVFFAVIQTGCSLGEEPLTGQLSRSLSDKLDTGFESSDSVDRQHTLTAVSVLSQVKEGTKVDPRIVGRFEALQILEADLYEVIEMYEGDALITKSLEVGDRRLVTGKFVADIERETSEGISWNFNFDLDEPLGNWAGIPLHEFSSAHVREKGGDKTFTEFKDRRLAAENITFLKSLEGNWTLIGLVEFTRDRVFCILGGGLEKDARVEAWLTIADSLDFANIMVVAASDEEKRESERLNEVNFLLNATPAYDDGGSISHIVFNPKYQTEFLCPNNPDLTLFALPESFTMQIENGHATLQGLAASKVFLKKR